MQGSRLHEWETGREGGKEALSLSTVECIVLLTLWFIILSCLGRCSKRPSHNKLLNRSIIQAIRMHVSEVPFSVVVSAHTIGAFLLHGTVWFGTARYGTTQFAFPPQFSTAIEWAGLFTHRYNCAASTAVTSS